MTWTEDHSQKCVSGTRGVFLTLMSWKMTQEIHGEVISPVAIVVKAAQIAGADEGVSLGLREAQKVLPHYQLSLFDEHSFFASRED